jgi:hypothetical protein
VSAELTKNGLQICKYAQVNQIKLLVLLVLPTIQLRRLVSNLKNQMELIHNALLKYLFGVQLILHVINALKVLLHLIKLQKFVKLVLMD